MKALNYDLAHNLAHALTYSPDGETPEEIFDRWYSDPSPAMEVAGTLIQPVVMTNEDRDEVIARIYTIINQA